MTKFIILSICSLSFATSFGQEQNVISAGGNYSGSNSGSISYTIGETIVQTIESPNHHITQGFHQDWIHFLTTNTFKADIKINVFPNPATHYINVESNQTSDLKIFDINGKEVLAKTLKQIEQVDLTHLAPGTYFLKFIEKDQTIKSIKIVIL